MDELSPSQEQLTFKHEHSMAALELRIQLQSDDFMGAESKSQQYINISAIVIAIVGGFSASTDLDGFEKLLLFVLGISFIYVFFHSLKSLSPSKWRQFLSTAKDREMFRSWMKTSIDKAYHDVMFEMYLTIIQDNDEVLRTKREHNSKARMGVYVLLIVTLILVAYRVFFSDFIT